MKIAISKFSFIFKSIFIFILVLIPVCKCASTCIVLVMTKDQIFVGADSKVIVEKQTLKGIRKEYKLACKIQREGKFNFAVAGEFPDYSLEIMHAYCSQINTSNLIDSIFTLKVDTIFKNILYQVKKKDIRYFRTLFLKKNPDPNTLILVWGFENNKPYTKLIEFIYTNPIKDSIVIKNKIVNNNAFWAIGFANEIYKLSEQTMQKMIQNNMVKAINDLISIEIKSHSDVVGGPISILYCDNKRSKWLQGGTCN